MKDGERRGRLVVSASISVGLTRSFANYKIVKEIGHGRMGKVYKARDALKRLVALKVMPKGTFTSTNLSKIEALAYANHPNLARVYEIGEYEGQPFIAQELLNETLDAKLNRNPWAPAEAADMVRDLAQAISGLHEMNIVHQDLNPKNVLLDTRGTPKIVDFGIAKILGNPDAPERPVALEDSLLYTSPEHFLGSQPFGAATDIYSLGAILYRCLTGRPPFKATTVQEAVERVIHDQPVPPRTLNDKVPEALEEICLRCLAKTPNERFTAPELVALLSRWSDEQRIRAGQTGASSHSWTKRSRGSAPGAEHVMGDVLESVPETMQQRPEAFPQVHESTEKQAQQVTNEQVQEVSNVPRFVNVCLTRPADHTAVPLHLGLAPNREYHLQLDIGALQSYSAVRNPARVPTELLPRTEDGHWLEVLVSSKDFIIPQRLHHLFLPHQGPSWVCNCPPGKQHTCNPQARRNYVWIPVTSPYEPRTAHIRLGLYYEKNLIQSQLLTAEISQTEREGQGYSSWIDYTLASNLTDLATLPPRTLNIMTNENADGTHLVVVNGDGFNPEFRLTEGQVSETVRPAREALRSIHFKESGGGFWEPKKRKNLYDSKTNSKKTSEFINDIQKLAHFGQKLWLLFLEDKSDWWNALQVPSTIQVSRVVGTRFLFPWALVYDIPLDIGTQQPYQLCKLLQNWDGERDQLVKNGARQCPFKDQHPKSNVLCPFGFWGLKHLIEQPASVAKNAIVCTEIRPTNQPPELVAGVSRNLDQNLTNKHLELMQQLHGIRVRPYYSRDEIKTALSESIELLYFYCHGLKKEVEGGHELSPYLQIGRTDEIHPEFFSTWRRELNDKTPWAKTPPLVFINGCHTVEITPESLLNFVDTFANAQAAGVIGTEITLDQSIASEAAIEFFVHLNDGKTVGESLQRMRLHLFAKNNVLGLAYTPYCSASLALKA